eukprot:Plantae.Rhodophyta-Purpureofilum_apyrenoidigerum.ctg22308.p1 GENE.Plantae.Rhodophyta-Purpureofilum_apyrenoidigerum.ctg22308~~Plantae.Rhodophyta-Purpureofilum_apyrenoidigerum.ctg22308.p1  ORF type:complete len:207 (+),score=42.14 Plantae.Rhodophyta-Purpureofilum_apyrenoidigerum.ctg22308:86-622(+)
MGIDIRDVVKRRRDRVVERILAAVEEIGEFRQVNFTTRTINQDPPAICSKRILSAAEASVEELQLKHTKLISRAYHDSLFMATKYPTAMIFIPCRRGISHRPDEFSSEDAITKGVNVLAKTLAKLSWNFSPKEEDEIDEAADSGDDDEMEPYPDYSDYDEGIEVQGGDEYPYSDHSDL